MTDEYQRQVADIIASEPRSSSYTPENPLKLYVKNHRWVTKSDVLSEIEKLQLKGIWRGDDVDARLAKGAYTDEELGEDFPDDLEVAEVHDDKGVIRYRLWGMNYGVIYLMAGDSLECVAFAAQHDLEHWTLDQRAIFWAMDRAMRRGDHGFQQGLKFCWWEQKCWDEIAELEPGTAQSHPYIRRQFAGEN